MNLGSVLWFLHDIVSSSFLSLLRPLSLLSYILHIFFSDFSLGPPLEPVDSFVAAASATMGGFFGSFWGPRQTDAADTHADPFHLEKFCATDSDLI